MTRLKIIVDCEFGVCVPVWRPEMDAKVIGFPALDPVVQVPILPAAPLICSTLSPKESDI